MGRSSPENVGRIESSTDICERLRTATTFPPPNARLFSVDVPSPCILTLIRSMDSKLLLNGSESTKRNHPKTYPATWLMRHYNLWYRTTYSNLGILTCGQLQGTAIGTSTTAVNYANLYDGLLEVIDSSQYLRNSSSSTDASLTMVLECGLETTTPSSGPPS